MHIVYIEGGTVWQTDKVEGVPTGVEYWLVNSQEKGFMDNNRDKREAWTWTADRAADGVGA